MFKILLYTLLYSSTYAMEFSMNLFCTSNDKEIPSIQTPKLYNGTSPAESPDNHSALDGLNEKLSKVSLSNNIKIEFETNRSLYFNSTQKENSTIAFLLFAQEIMINNPDIGNYYTIDSPLNVLSEYYQEMRKRLNVLQGEYPDLINLKYMSEKAIKGFVQKHCLEASQSGGLRICMPFKTYWNQYEQFATD